ncbi:MFS transporter [Amycolatopsis sp. NPDC051373]|uniref:MFS transporter n=1 Tax=Amycolatopsis sp. NPDC051373 TaxID=3155801 RepID=UPI00344BC21C
MAQTSGRAIVPVLASCGLVASFMQTLVVPLIPAFPKLLNASATDASWVVTVTLLAGAIITPVAGRLGDLYGSARRPVLFTNLASILVGFSMYAMALSFPQLLQAPSATGYGLGRTMVQAGLCLAPNGLVMMALSPVSARLTNRHGARVTLMTGSVVIALGYVFAILLMDNVVELITASVIIGAGVGIAYAAMPALIMGSVPVTETASANGLNALMRSVGTSTSSAVMATLLANLTITVGALTVPSLAGFRTTFAAAAVAAVIGLGLTALVPRVRAKTAAPEPAAV